MTLRKCVFCCYWVNKSISVITSSWLVVLFNSTMFLPSFRLLGLSICDRGVFVFIHHSGFLNSSSQCHQSLPHLFWFSVVRCTHIEDCDVFLEIWPFITMSCLSLFLITPFALESALSEKSIAAPSFFWLMLVWHIFLHSFTFNLHVSSYLKWVSYRPHIGEVRCNSYLCVYT